MSPEPEDQLTRTLHTEAERYLERGGADVELSHVLARAGEIRRGRRMRASLVMAAVAVVVGGTIGVTTFIGNGPGPSSHRPPPGVATQPDTPTTATGGPNPLSRIPLGGPLDHSYVELGVMHDSDGSTRTLPFGSTARIASITPYLGGYLVADAERPAVTLYNGSGNVVDSGPSSGRFVTSSDGVQTAYTMGRKLYSNPGSGMASGNGLVGPVGANGEPLGYLPGGLLYATGRSTAAGGPVLAMTGGSSVGHDLDSLLTINATDDLNDRVAGMADGGGRVISLKTHQVLWTSSSWTPFAFSSDGKYVAAADNRDTGSIAILDASTGHVVASANLANKGITLGGGPVTFDGAGNLILVAEQTDGGEAVLRLSPDNRLDRATRVVRVPIGSDNETPLVIPVGPQ